MVFSVCFSWVSSNIFLLVYSNFLKSNTEINTISACYQYLLKEANIKKNKQTKNLIVTRKSKILPSTSTSLMISLILFSDFEQPIISRMVPTISVEIHPFLLVSNALNAFLNTEITLQNLKGDWFITTFNSNIVFKDY